MTDTKLLLNPSILPFGNLKQFVNLVITITEIYAIVT